MEKAYDLKVLVEKIKSEGLEVGEEIAKKIIGHVFDWADESAKLSTTQVDDLLAVVYPKAKSYLLEQAEKINSQD